MKSVGNERYSVERNPFASAHPAATTLDRVKGSTSEAVTEEVGAAGELAL
ncbi:MAG TPA: hypothetical protein VMW80_07090 [Candidatus Dormibacteraeota bacterium]|nr:hypothetical protein [Candidatus Dormibacteraeota bacterium]